MNEFEIKNILERINEKAQYRAQYEHIIEQLIALGFKGLEQDSKGLTPLMYAVKYDYREIIERLLEYHKDIDISDTIFSKPLHIEDNIGDSIFDNTKYTNSNLIKIINLHDQNNKSAFNYAIEQKNYDIACKLILHGSSISNITTDQQKELMLYAAGQTHGLYCHQEHALRPVVGLLAIKVPEAVINYSDDYEYPRLLSYWCAYGHTKVVASLLESIDDNSRRIKIINHGDNNITPLDRVANNADKLTDQDYLKMVKYLLENGANKVMNNQDPIQLVAQLACYDGHLETFKYLEDKVDKKDFNTYIGLATRHNHINIIEYIWSNYKDYTTTYGGDTALHYAAWRGKLESIRYLCEHGADVNATNNRGEAPLDNAVDDNTIDVVKYFVLEQQAKAGKTKVLGWDNTIKEILGATIENINNKDIYGSTLLHKAVLTEKTLLIKNPCSLGCNINAQNFLGIAALHLAAEQSNPAILIFLLQHGAIYDICNFHNKTALDVALSARSYLNYKILSSIDFLFKSNSLNRDISSVIASYTSYADAYDPANPMLYMIGAKNSNGQTILHRAAFLNDKDAISLILRYDREYQQQKESQNPGHTVNYEKFDIAMQDTNGDTCMHLAAKNGGKDVISLLLDFAYNCNDLLNVHNNLGQTPIYIAAKNGYKDCVSIMVKNLNQSIDAKIEHDIDNLHNDILFSNEDNQDELDVLGNNISD